MWDFMAYKCTLTPRHIRSTLLNLSSTTAREKKSPFLSEHWHRQRRTSALKQAP
jgi:hypothetical protein